MSCRAVTPKASCTVLGSFGSQGGIQALADQPLEADGLRKGLCSQARRLSAGQLWILGGWAGGGIRNQGLGLSARARMGGQARVARS